MAVSQSKKPGKDPDPQMIQHQGPKVSKRDENGIFEEGSCISQGTTGSSSLHQGGHSGYCEELGN